MGVAGWMVHINYEDEDEKEGVMEHVQIPSNKLDLTLYPMFDSEW